jgi:hypothetical protein
MENDAEECCVSIKFKLSQGLINTNNFSIRVESWTLFLAFLGFFSALPVMFIVTWVLFLFKT